MDAGDGVKFNYHAEVFSRYEKTISGGILKSQ